MQMPGFDEASRITNKAKEAASAKVAEILARKKASAAGASADAPQPEREAGAEWTRERLDTEFGRIFAAQAAAIEGLKRRDRKPLVPYYDLLDEILPHLPTPGYQEWKALEQKDPALIEHLQALLRRHSDGEDRVRFLRETTPGGAIFPQVKKDDKHGGFRIDIGQPVEGRPDRFQVTPYDKTLALEYLTQEELERIAREDVSLEEILEKRGEAEALAQAERIIAEEFLKQVAPNSKSLSAEYLETMQAAARAFAKENAPNWLAEFEKSRSIKPTGPANKE